MILESFWNNIVCVGEAAACGERQSFRCSNRGRSEWLEPSNNPVQREFLKQRRKQMFGMHLCGNELWLVKSMTNGTICIMFTKHFLIQHGKSFRENDIHNRWILDIKTVLVMGLVSQVISCRHNQRFLVCCVRTETLSIFFCFFFFLLGCFFFFCNQRHLWCGIPRALHFFDLTCIVLITCTREFKSLKLVRSAGLEPDLGTI